MATDPQGSAAHRHYKQVMRPDGVTDPERIVFLMLRDHYPFPTHERDHAEWAREFAADVVEALNGT